MRTIKQEYPSTPIGEVENMCLMRTWGDYFYMIPVQDAAQALGLSREHLARVCLDRKLIAKKIYGRWWVAVKRAVIESRNGAQGDEKPVMLPIAN